MNKIRTYTISNQYHHKFTTTRNYTFVLYAFGTTDIHTISVTLIRIYNFDQTQYTDDWRREYIVRKNNILPALEQYD
jgi:hypothetical protein